MRAIRAISTQHQVSGCKNKATYYVYNIKQMQLIIYAEQYKCNCYLYNIVQMQLIMSTT
jgi:hypothetical protein